MIVTGSKTKLRWVTPVVAFAGAVLVVWLFMGGSAINAAISGEAGRDVIIAAIWSHVGRGAATAPLIIAYVVWRLMSSKGAYVQSGTLERISKIALWALSTLLIFLVVTGPIVVWTYGSDLKVFDWFVIPTPTGKVPVVHDPLEAAHVFAAVFAPWVAGVEFALLVVVGVLRR